MSSRYLNTELVKYRKMLILRKLVCVMTTSQPKQVLWEKYLESGCRRIKSFALESIII